MKPAEAVQAVMPCAAAVAFATFGQASAELYQLHNDGWIWRFTGAPCIGDSCPGWRRLDNNPKTRAIVAD